MNAPRLAPLLAILSLALAVIPARPAGAQDLPVAHPAFAAVWSRTDQPVAAGAVSRTWLWGPGPSHAGGGEPYAEAPGGRRLVQYFDKARMELTDPAADPIAVTTGLLARELITGQVQVGDAAFEQRQPAAVAVAGDPDDALGPTYAGLAGLLTRPPLAVGTIVTETISRDGSSGDDAGLARYGVTAAYHVPETNHTVASVFWDFLHTEGTINAGDRSVTARLFEPIFAATGLPIARAAWTKATVAGQVKDVLVQAFERRVLTYTPDNPAGWQVEMGNVGQHYYRWRYAADQPLPAPSVPTPAPPPATADLGGVRLALERVAGGLAAPVHLTHAGDGSGRLFVVEKAGRIRIVRDGVTLPQPFLDIRDLVGSRGSEQGLLGLAFHPNYERNGSFYVNYTDLAGDTVIARYQVSQDNRDIADRSSARTILAFDQPYANHNGGLLLFGPDGYLWIGTGDGGSAGDPHGNGQNPGVLLGKMLRLDVNSGEPYGIPPDNPYADGAGGRAEVWAIGLRNPWRYSFDRATGDLYLADVGQNAYEEVNVTPAGRRGGLNYGWNRMEGAHCFRSAGGCDRTGLELPVAEYGRAKGCSVTGGFVYRGQRSPQLAGVYFYGDYCSGIIWGLARGADGGWQTRELLDTNLNISTFGEDEAGEVYVANMASGEIFRLTQAAG